MQDDIRKELMDMQEQELASIKRPGEVDLCTKEEFEFRIKEIAKCKRDIVYFAEHYYRVINLDKGLHIIQLYDVQKEFLRFLVENNKVVCCSGRQQGKSTIYCIYSLWQTMFFPEKKIMILANKAATALELLSRIATAYEYLPKWIKCSCTEFNKSSLTFGNMSSIKAFASSSDAARGFSANCVKYQTLITVKDRAHNDQVRQIEIGQLFSQMKAICKKHDGTQMHNGNPDEVIYNEVLDVDRLQILADNDKWVDVTQLSQTKPSKLVIVRTQHHRLTCSPKHKLISSKRQTLNAEDSFGHEIFTSHGLEVVIDVEKLQDEEPLYDVSLADSSQHLYMADGVLSHNCVICDEFAFLQKNIADKLFTSMFPVISSSKNGKFILVSTPNGTGNLYYDIWCQANSKEVGKNLEGWKPFTMWWYQVPGHDQKWKEAQIAAIGKERFAQEFNNEFLASSTIKKLIPDDVIEGYRIKLSEKWALDRDFVDGKKQKIFSEKGDKLYEFTMWHEFDPRRTYLASGDCAEGVGGDSSVLNVWDVTDLSNIVQCAKFASSTVSPVEFAFITAKMLAVYNHPYYICERNGIGSGYLDSLQITYGYPRCVTEGKKGEAGVFSHVTQKERACVWAREMMTTVGFGWTIYDKDLLDEFTTFCKKDNKGVHQVYAAVSPAHDDLVMTWVWACWILNPEVVEKYYICCETFTSVLQKIYPKLLQPQEEYSQADISKVTNDTLHKEFMEFKEEICNKLGRALLDEKLENEEAERQGFVVKRPQDLRDPYFGDYDFSPSWNGPSRSMPDMGLGGNRPPPSYII